MKVTRRDLLVWGAGAAAGVVLTPVPWKVLDDISIWTQNWPWIPQPARGPVEVKASACTLCPKGCGVRVRMAAGWPVGVAGLPRQGGGQGALCALGFAAHQLNWHPKRLRAVRHRGRPASWNEARAAFAKACSEGPVGIVDGYRGRAASSLFQSFVQKHGGEYFALVGPEIAALKPYEPWTGVAAESLGYDLENANTVVSFGAPLLDGWGAPGRFSRVWAERAAGKVEPDLRLIQLEASFSSTGARAWQRIEIRADSEAALAAGLARVLLEEQLVRARGPMPPMTLAESVERCGLGADRIRDLARTLVAHAPTVAIASDDNPALAALNVVLGAVGTRGGIVQSSKQASRPGSAGADLRSARAVLIDSSVPWDFAPKTDAEIFRFAGWDGGSTQPDWLLPAPGFLEDLTDIPTTPAAANATYAIAPSLVKAPQEVLSAAAFLNNVDPTLASLENIIRARCEELFRGRSGSVWAEGATPVAQIASAEKLEAQLRGGAVWVDEPPAPGKLRCKLNEWPASTSASSLSVPTAWPLPVLPPLASKLNEESDLQPERSNA